MMAMDRLGTYKEMGLSSSVHFATQHLKISERSAKTTLSVTKQLEELPLLARAVLHEEIEWSQIREVVSVATPETEEMWRELCIELNCKQIQILVAATPKGGVPGEVASKLARKTSEYRCRFQPEVVVLIERGLQKMSKKLGKPMMFREAVERFFTEFLADKPYDEAAEKMLEEARKDFLAGRIQQEPLVLKAREVAREFGLLQESDDDESRDRESLDEESILKNQALQALGDMHRAIGGSFSWESWESSAPSSTDLTHVGENNPLSSTPPYSLECDSHPAHLEQEHSKEHPKRPASKVTPLQTPSQGPSNNPRFKPEAPALLNELMAHLKFNANSRFPTKAQRKALLRRDRYCCRTPGCTNHLFLEIHHIKRYSQGGKTLPELLVTLCSRCHKNTEEGKLFVRLIKNGQLVFTDKHDNNLEQLERQERALWLDYWLGWKGQETDSHWARAMGFSQSAA